MQAKEAKYAKKDLLYLTNRSLKIDEKGKWWQLMRGNYVRSFYLPEHHLTPCVGTHHYKSRIPPHIIENSIFCDCGRNKESIDATVCQLCNMSMIVINCSDKGELVQEAVEILKPLLCPTCNERFADHAILETHIKAHNYAALENSRSLHPESMKVAELKRELQCRGLSVSGSKDILIKRLEEHLAGFL